jgi:hypothetical protein
MTCGRPYRLDALARTAVPGSRVIRFDLVRVVQRRCVQRQSLVRRRIMLAVLHRPLHAIADGVAFGWVESGEKPNNEREIYVGLHGSR